MPIDLADTRPLCAVYIGWHHSFALGERVAHRLYQHFRRDLFTNVAGGVGLSVLYRSANAPTCDSPAPVSFADSHIAVVFLLVSAAMARDASWREYVRTMIADCESQGLTARVIPVFLDGYGKDLVGDINGIRYYEWSDAPELVEIRLISTLTHELARMLRTYLASKAHPGVSGRELDAY